MKTLSLVRSVCISIVGLFCPIINAAASGAPPARFIVGVSPFLSAPERQTAHKEGLLLVLEKSRPGDHIEVVDAFNLQPIARIAVPKGNTFEHNARARTVRLAPQLRQLGAFFAANTPPESPEMAGAIRLPQFLEYVTTHLRADSEPMAVILIASPFYADGLENSFTMMNGYPADPCFVAGRKTTPYSTAEKKNWLARVTVHYCYFRQSCFVSDLHFDRIQRVWGMFISQQGGSLVSFAADADVVFERAARGATKPLAFEPLDVNDKRPRMLRVVGNRILEEDANTTESVRQKPSPVSPHSPVETSSAKVVPLPPTGSVQRVATNTVPVRVERGADAIPSPAQTHLKAEAYATEKPIHSATGNPAVSPQRSARPVPMPLELPKPAIGNIGIAIVWNGQPKTDVDLWVAAKSGLPEAYWHRPEVDRVRYFRDIRTSQGTQRSDAWTTHWEYAEVTGAQVNEPTIWLNLYDAEGRVDGVIRAQFQGKSVDKSFRFDVTNGDHGRNANFPVRLHSRYWIRVNLADFFPELAVWAK
jgi:hypothetical protein